MKYVALSLLALLLIGCDGSRTRLNPGAQRAVYVATPQWMFQHTFGVYRGDYVKREIYDTTDGSITICEQEHEWRLARQFARALLGPAWTHQNPRDGWELLELYDSPTFSFNLPKDGGRYIVEAPQPPTAADTQRALDAAIEAERAEKAAKP